MDKKIEISQYDFRNLVWEVCDYAILEGKNADWVKVDDSFRKLVDDYEVDEYFDTIDPDVLSDLYETIQRLNYLIGITTRGFGEDEKTILRKLREIYNIRNVAVRLTT